MSSILIASTPGQGHVNPLLAAAQGFAGRGDDVRFLTGTRFADKVTAAGASFLPLPAEADLDESVLGDVPERAQLRGVKAVAFDIERFFVGPSRAQYEAVVEAIATKRVDAVVVDPAFLGAAYLLGHPRASRPPVVVGGVLPLWIASRDTAPFGAGLAPARVLNRPRNAVLSAVTRHVLRQPNRASNEIHRQLHGRDMPGAMTDWCRRADAYVQFSVPSFEYPLSDAPETLHFIGPLTGHSSQFPLPDWWADLDGSRPVVHVTQGTVANLDYSQTIAPTLEALADDDVLVVVATGGRPLDTLPPLPANARAAVFLPYDELLPRTSVYVTNGGYGGVHYAMRHGVPIVATGGKEDKPEVGARVAWSGVGRRIRSEHPSPRALRRAIHAVLNEPRYRLASRRIAADIAAAPGFAGLATVVDTLTQSPCPPSTPVDRPRNGSPEGNSVVA